MATKEDLIHVLLVTFPAQGHINPLLRLGKLIASKGKVLITFSATTSIGDKMKKAGAAVSGDPAPVGTRGGMIRFEFFGDGCTEENEEYDLDNYLPKLEAYGKKELKGIINHHAETGRPVSCLINNPFVPWVSDLADELNIPCAVLWVQSCACFSSYYHFEKSLITFPSEDQPEIDVRLPNMPVLKFDEIPSFLHPSTPYSFLRRAILGQFKNLSKNFCVLMETFDALEGDLIKYMSQICQIRAVGPLFKNPLLESDSSRSISGDLIKADECLEWLDSKADSSVVYISFGSIVSLSQEQVSEMAYGVLNSGVSFLWVMRTSAISTEESSKLPKGLLEEAGERGMVVQWSPQAQVLAHRAVSCFVTHCGWNSTLEALSSGVPVVAFPQWGDQVTDAKYLVDEWKVGVRMCRGEADHKLIGRVEVEECIREATHGVKAVEMKTNAMKWKKAAEEAVAIGGTSDRNIEEFVDEIRKLSLKKLG